MANNFVQPGDVIELIAPSGGVVVGAPLLIGGMLVVPLVTAAQTVAFSAQFTGVWTLAKTSAQAWTEGQKVYWDAGNSRADSDGTLGPLIGVAVAVAANPTATGVVRLNGSAPDIAEGPQAAIVSLTTAFGTGNDALEDVTSSFSQTILNNNFADCTDKIQEILVALRAAGVIAT